MPELTEEQIMLRDAAQSWVRQRAPVSALRKLRANGSAAHGFDPATYAEIAEMGWASVIVPEEHGGADFGYASLGLILEQLGKTLVASPLLSSGLAGASALRLGGTAEQQARWLPGIADGSTVATLAVDEGARHDPLGIRLRADADADADFTGWRLSGNKQPVLHGMAADLLIVAARTAGSPDEADGITLFLVAADAVGIERTALVEIETRGAAAVDFDGVALGADAVLGEVGEGAVLLDAILDRARIGTAAEMLGAAQEAFETTLDYLRTRIQFGEIIGTFQALQHRVSALYGEIELTRSAVEAAFAALDRDGPDVPELASIAKVLAGETLRLVASEMIQLHGGIGMTNEHDAGHYYKRARVADMSYGSAAYHRERFAALTGH
jgi:alkylation response protein AidB-like acyl-CoA dehydrogenase